MLFIIGTDYRALTISPRITESIQIRCYARDLIQKIHPTMWCRLSYESEDCFFAKQEIQYIDMTNAVFIRK